MMIELATGMVLTVRYDETGDTETFLLGIRGAEYDDMKVYSVQSPLGTAILGARPGCPCSRRPPPVTAGAIRYPAAQPFP